MIPGPIPHALRNLTQVDDMLISGFFPVMSIYTKPNGSQRAYKSYIITLPNDVKKLADTLTWHSRDIPVVVFKYNTKDNIIYIKLKRKTLKMP